MDLWQRPSNLGVGPSTLDLFDPFDHLDQNLCRNLLWIDRPHFLEPVLPRVPHKYRITVDCSGFSPKSIKTELNQDKTQLIVSAKEGENQTNQESDYSMREFQRTFKLPKDVETDKMVSFVTSEGRLVVELPIHEEENHTKRMKLSEGLALTVPNVITDKNGKSIMKVNFDVPVDIDPSKIKVTCKDRDLIVQAEDKVDRNDGNFSSCYFYRRCTLPENTDLNSLKCVLDNEKLTVEAPYNADLKPCLQKLIPIEMKQQNGSK